jgi:hypothetical protein
MARRRAQCRQLDRGADPRAGGCREVDASQRDRAREEVAWVENDRMDERRGLGSQRGEVEAVAARSPDADDVVVAAR